MISSEDGNRLTRLQHAATTTRAARREERRLWARVLRQIRERWALAVSTSVVFDDGVDSLARVPRRLAAEDVHRLSEVIAYFEREMMP